MENSAVKTSNFEEKKTKKIVDLSEKSLDHHKKIENLSVSYKNAHRKLTFVGVSEISVRISLIASVGGRHLCAIGRSQKVSKPPTVATLPLYSLPKAIGPDPPNLLPIVIPWPGPMDISMFVSHLYLNEKSVYIFISRMLCRIKAVELILSN